MGTEIKQAILELIGKNRKIHKNTEAKLDREKNKTEIYDQLAILYERHVEDAEIKNKDILQKHGLLGKEHLIEYVRYKYIGMKIDDVGVSNSIGAYELFKYMIEGRDPEIKKYMDDEIQKFLESETSNSKDEDSYSRDWEEELALNDIYVDSGLINKMFYTLRNINIANQAKFDVINSMLKDIKEDVKTENAEEKDIKGLIEKYLQNNKPSIPLHNIEQAIHLYKIQNLNENKEINKVLKLLRSSKTSLDKLNFSNEKKLIDYLYEEIDKRPGQLKNLQYYMLERSMGFEMKKIILKTVNEIEKNHKEIDLEKEILKISGMESMKDIHVYKRLGELYVDSYPDYDVYVDAINTLNNIISRWLILLETWEIEGYIQKKDILEEISLFPRFCNSLGYRSDYRIRKDFTKEQYQVYNGLKSANKNEEYTRECENIKARIFEDIPSIIFVEWHKRR